MLAVISDLHFQHTSHDALRYAVDGVVHELEVRRNVTPEAFQRFFWEIQAVVEHRRAREVELVFAGDIFEIHRTPLWFFDGSGARPSDPELGEDRADNPLRNLVHRILDHVVRDNEGCWPVIARFVRSGEYELRGVPHRLPESVAIRAHFIPGNHDRLVNGWPSVRARVRELLGVGGEPGAPFPHVLDYPRGPDGRGYGVRIRHGHEYDAWNFPVSVERGKALQSADEVYLRPSLGDYLTCDVATRMATCFRSRYARPLREDGPRARALRRLYVALTEFDDVRPFSLLLTYMAREFGASDQHTFEALRPVIRDAIEVAEQHPFVVSEAARLGVSSLKRLLAGWALKSVPFDLLRAVIGLSGSASQFTLDAEVPPAELARFEPALADGAVETVIAGHTHLPDQVPLPGGRAEPERMREEGHYFIDSGTWRTTIRKGAGGVFGRVRAFTMVFAYDEAERAVARPSGEEGRRFETWTGHLASGSVGPAVRVVGPLRASGQRLRLRSLEVERVEQEFRGAELLLHVGVDTEARRIRRDGVREGDVIDLAGSKPIPLFADLDGELWLHGRELDVITEDDALPWGLLPLERDGSGFREGEGQLRVADEVNAFVLRFEVVGA